MAELLHGPLNKSLYTQTLELVTKILLYSPEKASFHYKNTGLGNFDVLGLFNKKELHVVIGDVDVNLSQLFRKANFSHIQMDQVDSQKFTKDTGINYHSYYPEIYKYVEKHGELSDAEKEAVHSYTGAGYRGINDLLYKSNILFNQVNQNSVRDTVLKAVLLSSGLNKISPSPTDHNVKTYRGERYTPQHEINERIRLINQGGGFTEQPAYMSTSTDKSISNRFRGNCTIIFDSIYGTSVEKASASNFEKEYLISPGQIYWKKYEYINGIHTFYAEAVRPLIPAKEETCAQDIANFNKLLTIAKNKGVPSSFLTPFVQQVISNPVEPGAALSTVVPVMTTVTVKTTKEKVIKGLSTASLIGVGFYLLAVGFTLIAPPFGIAFSGVALWGSTLFGGLLLAEGAFSFIPALMHFVKQRLTPAPVQPAPFQAPDVQPALFQAPVPTQQKPVAGAQKNVGTSATQQASEYKVFLEKEESAVQALENLLISKFPQAPQFIAKLHTILNLDNANGDKLLLMQYTHLLENKVNEAHPDEFPVVEQEVLEEAATAIKEKTLII